MNYLLPQKIVAAVRTNFCSRDRPLQESDDQLLLFALERPGIE